MDSNLERIHILGIGNLGLLYAHSLAIKPTPPPLTLLLHRPALLQEWERVRRKVEFTKFGIPSTEGNYDVELVTSPSQSSRQGDGASEREGEIIKNLIVGTKTIHTTKALEAIKHRLNSHSTILFLQNGLGTIEEVTTSLFPNPSTRPSYLAAVTSHGVYSLSPFRSVHAGPAGVYIGPYFVKDSDSSPSLEQQEEKPLRPEYLYQQVIDSPLLNTTSVPAEELIMLQLEKLSMNASINPLTVIFNCKNGELFDKLPVRVLMEQVLQEVGMVIRRYILPAPSSTLAFSDEALGLEKRFSFLNLEEKVFEIAKKTAENTSSMRQDFLAGRETEIDYINGWVVERGREMGINVTHNEIVMKMVRERTVIKTTAEEVVKILVHKNLLANF